MRQKSAVYEKADIDEASVSRRINGLKFDEPSASRGIYGLSFDGIYRNGGRNKALDDLFCCFRKQRLEYDCEFGTRELLIVASFEEKIGGVISGCCGCL